VSVVTKDEWIQWKSSPITKAFFEAAAYRIQDAKDILGMSAGFDSTSDNFYRGFIAAYVEMHDFKVEDIVEDED